MSFYYKTHLKNNKIKYLLDIIEYSFTNSYTKVSCLFTRHAIKLGNNYFQILYILLFTKKEKGIPSNANNHIMCQYKKLAPRHEIRCAACLRAPMCACVRVTHLRARSANFGRFRRPNICLLPPSCNGDQRNLTYATDA